MTMAMTSVQLPRTIYHEIIAHAREGKPEEICGILRGRAGRAFQLYRARNVAEDRIDNYDVDSQTLLKQFEFEEAGDEMIGIYHSHPTSVAYPSATDAWNAHYPETYYLICSLQFDHAPLVRAFRMLPAWPDADIKTIQHSLPFREVRPQLFAYYQAVGEPVPQAIATLFAVLQPPLYLVFNTDESGAVEDFRAVRVQEFPLEILEHGQA